MNSKLYGSIIFCIWLICSLIFIFNPVLSGIYLAIINIAFMIAAILSFPDQP